MKKRFFVLFLLTLMLSGSVFGLDAHARASDQIVAYNVTVSAQGNGEVRVSAVIYGTQSSMTKIGFSVIVLYEKTSSGWKSVCTADNQYNYDAGSHGYRFTYQGVAGREYYAAASFVAINSAGGDMRTANSSSIVAE